MLIDRFTGSLYRWIRQNSCSVHRLESLIFYNSDRKSRKIVVLPPRSVIFDDRFPKNQLRTSHTSGTFEWCFHFGTVKTITEYCDEEYVRSAWQL